MKNQTLRITILGTYCFFVSACGGGSGGGNDSQPPGFLSQVVLESANTSPEIDISSTVTVQENQINVLTAVVSDVDSGDILTLSISGGQDAALFSIDNNSGAITFNTAPDYEAPSDENVSNDYEIEVSLSDGIESVTKNIIVSVSDVDDVPPSFISPATFNVQENQTLIGTLSASDPDSPSTTFSAVNSDITITNEGILSFFTAPDYEANNRYSVIVTASDGANSTTQTISIIIDDVDESITGPSVAVWNPFDGATKNGNIFTWPTGAQDWAGFENTNRSLIPISFSEGGSINFTAMIPTGDVEVGIKFTFEQSVWPNVEPQFDTEIITVDGNSEKKYSILIPTRPADQTYRSILMKITERDKSVIIKDMTIISGGNIDGNTFENSADAGENLSVITWSRVDSKVKRDVEARISNLVAQMTLEEKVGQMVQAEIGSVTPEDIRFFDIGSVLNGGGSHPNGKASPVSDWVALADRYFDASTDVRDGGVGIPIIWGTDAVHGHNNVMGATIFPHNIGLGAMNNAELVREIGEITALEVASTGIDWTFAPVVAVIRDDRWGRTYEGYSEDPEVVRVYSYAMVEGLQGEGGTVDLFDPGRIVATAKHFIGDGGTTNGIDQGNTDISEQDLRDIHGAGYFSSLEAGVQTVMATFNSWQRNKVHGSKYLLTTVLKEQMDFDGFVIGDWNGHGQVPGCSDEHCAAAINAGIDMVMVPQSWKAFIQNTIDQVISGEIPITRVDDAVTRILRVKTRAGLLDAPKPSERAHTNAADLVGNENHRKLARQAVRESLILLKNRNGLLPLNPNSRVLVTGGGADNIAQQTGGWTLSWQGTGNSNDDFPKGTSIYDGIKQAVEAAGGSVELSIDGSFLEEMPEVAIAVFGETPYAEGAGDLSTLEYQAGAKEDLAMLNSLRQQGISVVSIFLSGRPMWVNAELNSSDAFVAAWLPGTEGAGIADVIFKRSDLTTNYDFSGKLSFSWPKRPDQTVLNRYDTVYNPLFPFGFGLTYSDIDMLGELVTDGELDSQATASFSAPGLIEAENYTNMYGVQVEITSDISGGSNVGFMDPGDWVEYRIDVVKEGNYKIEYRLASLGGSDGFVVRLNNQNMDSQTVTDTGGWQDWITQSSQIKLAAGQNVLRLNAVGGGWNINWIRFIEEYP
tara:strand:+ start:7155 stop:10604 length:3450 start_codon:yes stop_codon:yes gene_type:complete